MFLSLRLDKVLDRNLRELNNEWDRLKETINEENEP